MPVLRDSYRLKRDVWMLSDEEYAPIGEALHSRLRDIKQYRSDNRASLSKAVANTSSDAIAHYERLTGEVLAHPDQLYAVRASDYGPDCHACGKPLRTPRARLCVECGAERLPG